MDQLWALTHKQHIGLIVDHGLSNVTRSGVIEKKVAVGD